MYTRVPELSFSESHPVNSSAPADDRQTCRPTVLSDRHAGRARFSHACMRQRQGADMRLQNSTALLLQARPHRLGRKHLGIMNAEQSH